MKNILTLIIVVFLMSCQKKESPTPAAQASFNGAFHLESIIVSDPAFSNAPKTNLVINVTGNDLTIASLNTLLNGEITGYINGTSAVLNTKSIDTHYKFSGGNMTLNGTKLNVSYQFKIYNNGGVLTDDVSYTLGYSK